MGRLRLLSLQNHLGHLTDPGIVLFQSLLLQACRSEFLRRDDDRNPFGWSGCLRGCLRSCLQGALSQRKVRLHGDALVLFSLLPLGFLLGGPLLLSPLLGGLFPGGLLQFGFLFLSLLLVGPFLLGPFLLGLPLLSIFLLSLLFVGSLLVGLVLLGIILQSLVLLGLLLLVSLHAGQYLCLLLPDFLEDDFFDLLLLGCSMTGKDRGKGRGVCKWAEKVSFC
ncbi:hypothetical protein PG991_006454 [Apiospora marii]|uniref:ABC transmembrane type-1 domain-containing protein n=1 Tax=Apiospora marii TaxID=335849 RepID=A0ABR1RZ67_9PEZI